MTTPEAMDVVRMVLTGQVNRDVVGLINRHGPFAVGMSGEDAHLMTARKVQATGESGEPIDIGQVGEVESVNPGAIIALIADGRIPVISSVARGESDDVLNVNADTAAAALAVALGAAKLVMLTDVAGLYASWTPERGAAWTDERGSEAEERGGKAAPEALRPAGSSGGSLPRANTAVSGDRPAQVISELGAADLAVMLPTLSGGMIPKMTACLTAVTGGVPQAHVLDGRLPHAVLLEIFTDSGIGTMVVPDGEAKSHE